MAAWSPPTWSRRWTSAPDPGPSTPRSLVRMSARCGPGRGAHVLDVPAGHLAQRGRAVEPGPLLEVVDDGGLPAGAGQSRAHPLLDDGEVAVPLRRRDAPLVEAPAASGTSVSRTRRAAGASVPSQ